MPTRSRHRAPILAEKAASRQRNGHCVQLRLLCEHQSGVRLGLPFHLLAGGVKLYTHMHFATPAQTEMAFGRRQRVVAMRALAVEDSHLFKPEELFGLAGLGDPNLRAGRAAVTV